MKPRRDRGRRRRFGEQPSMESDVETFFGIPERTGTDHKTQQLCRQVYRTLTCALSGETGDDVLRKLVVESVVPAPAGSRLVVSVYFIGEAKAPVWDVLERLDRIAPRLRHAVASAIVRKRAPELMFRIVSPEVQP